MCTREITAFDNPSGGRPIFGWAGVKAGLPAIKLPCGKCPECVRDYYSQWATRGSRELMHWDSTLFITLTYDEKHYPKDRSLKKRHVQNFIKRVKKHFKSTDENPIRQIYCGEYGTQTLRPHYHVILFNVDFSDKKLLRTTNQNHKVFTSKTLDRLWKHQGFAEFGHATTGSIAYLFKYILKKKTRKEKRKPLTLEFSDGCYDVEHEFIEASRNPGIGHWYHGNDSLKKGFLTENGVRKKIPKYYMEHLRKHDPDTYDYLSNMKFDFMETKPTETALRKQQKEAVQKKLTDTKRKL